MNDDTPKDRVPVRRVPAEPPQPYVTETVTPRRDAFPYVMGALIAALVVGMGVIIFILGSGSNSPAQVTNFPTAVPTSPSDVIPTPQPTNGAGASDVTEANTPAGSGASPVATIVSTVPVGSRDQDVPRISMDDFKKLYDDPARRPIIIDVRTTPGYDSGHIKGSIHFPEDQLAALVSTLPKDKLVVAYCSWPAENSSARVALKLHQDYGYSFDNLKALQGGWGEWDNRNKADPAGYPIEKK